MRLMVILTLCLIVVTAAPSWSQTGGTVSPFGMGVGSRDLSLGGSNIAGCDYATAAYWNPSRLARSEHYSLTGFNTRLYDADASYQYLGIVIPTLDWGSVGIGVTRLGIGGIEKRDASNILQDTISDSRLNFRLAYGRTFGSIDLGLALSLESHRLDAYKGSSTPGLDLAASRVISIPNSAISEVTLSVVGRNLIAPSMRLVDEAVKLPFEIHAGLGTRLLLAEGSRQSVELFGGLTKSENAPALGSAGLEYSLFDMLQLRGGWQGDRFSGGAGLSYNGFSFDYAMVNRDLGVLHMISLTANLGKSVEDRRSIRAARREADFNRAMTSRLTQKNAELAGQLLAEGRTALVQGDLITADADLDRALFLARVSDVDTTEYAALAAQVREQIQTEARQVRLAENLDSARTRLANADFLGCQYFAGLAIAMDSTSAEAIGLRDSALTATEEAEKQQEFIRSRVWSIDSLVSYGAPTEALAAAQALSAMVPDNAAVAMALKRAEFETFKALAEAEMAGKEFSRSVTYLDSALARFPGQARCLELLQICRAELKKQAVTAETPAAAKAPLSKELTRQVQAQYEKAQAAFNRGDLVQAIGQWEEVDRLAPGYQSVRDYLLKAYRYVGIDLYGKNRLADAMKIWEKALVLAPGNAELNAYARRTRNEIDKLKELTYDN